MISTTHLPFGSPRRSMGPAHVRIVCVRRLPTYSFSAGQLAGAVDRLLDDGDLRKRLGQASARLQANPGNERAAELIERVARTGEPVESS